MFRQNLFKAKLVENGVSTRDMAGIIGCNEATLYRKMNGVSDFTRNEIQLIKQALSLTSADVEAIFLPGITYTQVQLNFLHGSL